MKWVNSKRWLSLSVAFCLLLSGTSFAEVCLTDGEYEELQGIFLELETQAETRRQELIEVKTQLTTASSELTASKQAMTLALSSLAEAEKSLQEQRIDTIVVVLTVAVGSFLAGAGVRAIFDRSNDEFIDTIKLYR